MKRKFSGCPLWVEVVHRSLQWVDYEIISRLSRWTVDRRMPLMDRHCHCANCLERDQKTPGWRPPSALQKFINKLKRNREAA